MILLLIALLSLVAVYFTRLLSRNNMKGAAISVTVLYAYLIAWTYAIFIIDIADLGFTETETQISLLHGSNIYHSFVALTARMAVIPLPLLQAIVIFAITVILAGIVVALHGVLEISKEIIHFVKNKYNNQYKTYDRYIEVISTPIRKTSIIRMHCRANC